MTLVDGRARTHTQAVVELEVLATDNTLVTGPRLGAKPS